MITINRSEHNPILRPDENQSWEAEGVFNGCPIKKEKNIYLLYRAVSLPHYHAAANINIKVSDIGIAKSLDGIHFKDRRKFIIPEYPWEQYGCEDPRVTKIDDNYFIFYTALSKYPFTAEGIKVGVAVSKDLKKIEEKHLVTPFNAKAMALFPERINNKLWAVLSVHTDMPPTKIAIASFDRKEEIWSEDYWKTWYADLNSHTLSLQRRMEDHIEVGAPPLKTKHGWLLLYSYIRDYFSPRRLFTVEAALLDFKNPLRILSQTSAPLMTPEEEYERYGAVSNVIFPSGAIMKGDKIHLYYGAADTVCCLATFSYSSLVRVMKEVGRKIAVLIRNKTNPIITPRPENQWEAKAVFNPAAIYEAGKVHLVYRAMSNNNTSVFGYASSVDGVNFTERSSNPIYQPTQLFEQKAISGQNSGCEDPRLTKIGKTVYMCYTAFNGKNPPRIALTSIRLDKFLKKEWQWQQPVLISPPDFDNKDACIFPEKVKGKYLIFHRLGRDVDIALVPNLKFDGSTWLEEYIWLRIRQGFWDSKKVGIAAPPVKTKKGWLLLYHGVSEDSIYRVGAVLLDLKDPTKIIGRTSHPILEPEKDYEKEGQVPNIVFPCGNVVISNKLFVYYGAADKCVAAAEIELDKILRSLKE